MISIVNEQIYSFVIELQILFKKIGRDL